MTDYTDCLNVNLDAAELIKVRRDHWPVIIEAIDNSIKTLNEFKTKKKPELDLMTANKNLDEAWASLDRSKAHIAAGFIGELAMLQALKDAATAAEAAANA